MTPWWVTILTALAGGAIALGGALVNGRLDRRRARREEWFRRVQWAQQLTVSDRDRDWESGYRILQSLADSDPATADDLRLLYGLTDNTNFESASEPTLFIVGHTESSNDTNAAEEDQ